MSPSFQMSVCLLSAQSGNLTVPLLIKLWPIELDGDFVIPLTRIVFSLRDGLPGCRFLIGEVPGEPRIFCTDLHLQHVKPWRYS
jgi:hypothetical protein